MSPYSITREDAGRDVRAIRTALSCLRAVGVNTSVAVELDGLAYSIEEQLKPVIDEPTEFGSMVQARWIEAPDYIEPLPWVYTPWQGEHRWRSGDGLTAVWSDLSDVEVLRIGAGDDGLREAAARIVDVLDASPATAALVTARYPGLDHAIDLVRRHLPQSDGGAAAPPADRIGAATPSAAERATTTAAPSSAPDRPLSSFIHDTLVAHQRKDASFCLCGWGVWGASHASHVAELLLEGIDHSLFTEGFDVACNEIIKDLARLRDEAITGEREDAYDKAIAAVERQREWK